MPYQRTKCQISPFHKNTFAILVGIGIDSFSIAERNGKGQILVAAWVPNSTDAGEIYIRGWGWLYPIINNYFDFW